MSDLSKKEFLTCVSKSRVIDPATLKNWLVAANAADEQITADHLADRLVADKLLTAWQVKYLLTGRSRLNIGSYRLLERIQRDELGDRFLAIHQQLGRKVDIQVLPANLTKDKNRCDIFIQKASQTAKLDHPHLTHVYDIDQEGGRYFLVTEHIEGLSLAETPRATMTTVDVARMTEQSIRGLQFAHENQVTHGDLTPQDVVLSLDKGVSIRNLAVSPIRSAMATNVSGEANQQDWLALAKIFAVVLQEIPQSDDIAQRAELKNALRTLAKGDSQSVELSLQQLQQWFETHAPLSVNQPPADHDDEDTFVEGDPFAGLEDFSAADAASTNQRAGKFQFSDEPVAASSASELATLPVLKQSTNRTVKKKSGTRQQHDDSDSERNPHGVDEGAIESDGWLARTARENPIGLVATAMVLVGMIFGGLAFSVSYWWGSPNLENNAGVNNSTNPAASTNATTFLKPTNPGPLSTPQNGTNQPDFSDTTEMERRTTSLTNSNGATKNGSPKKKPSNNLAVESQTNSDTSPVDNAVSQDQTSVNTTASSQSRATDLANKSTPVHSANDPDNQPTGLNSVAAKSPTPKAETSKTEPAKSKPSKTEPVKAKQPTPATADTSKPFAKFPTATDLPPLDNTTETKISNLVIGNRFLLGAELDVHPQAGRGKMLFEIDRAPDNNQTWIVTVRRNQRDKAQPIAQFRRTETEFLFQWLPEAAKNRLAGYLKNGQLKLILPTESTWLKLRRPILLKPLMLTPEALTADLEIDADYLPEMEILAIELLPTPIPNSELKPNRIDLLEGIPGRIMLVPDETEPFVWIQLNADVKQKIRLQANLVGHILGQVKPVRELDDLNELATLLKQQESTLKLQYDQAVKTKAPPGQGEEFDKLRAAAKKAWEAAQVRRQQAIKYTELAPAAMNQPIGIRIVAKMEGHEIEIAKTKMPPRPAKTSAPKK